MPWFNAVDVCRVLDIKNVSMALKNNVEPKDLIINETLTSGWRQKANFINESGLYALILGSKLPNAERKHADELAQTCGKTYRGNADKMQCLTQKALVS